MPLPHTGGGACVVTVTDAGEPEQVALPLPFEQLMLKLVVAVIAGDVQLPLVARVPAQPEEPPEATHDVAPPLEDQVKIGVTFPEAPRAQVIALVIVKVTGVEIGTLP
jgi:hypothetical protein